MNIIKKEKKWIAVYLTFSLLLTAIRLINPLLVSRFFDNAGGSDIEYLLKIVLILLSASICGGFLNIFCVDFRYKSQKQDRPEGKERVFGKAAAS